MNSARQTLDYFNSYEPHQMQLGFHKSKAKIKSIIAGARGGKTLGAGMEIGRRAIWQPGYWQEDIDGGKPYQLLVSAPTYRMLDRICIPEILRIFPPAIRVGKKYNQSKNILEIQGLKGRTLIHFISSYEAERIEGMQLYGAWLDEFMQMKESYFNEAKTRCIDRRGELILSGTPKGMNWGYKKIFLEAQKKESNVYCSYYKTADNPYFPAEELEEARKSMPLEYYLRTYEASFEVFEGQVYKEFRRGTHVIDKLPEKRKIVYAFAGHDFGFGSPTATVYFGKDQRGNIYALDEIYLAETLTSQIADIMKTKEARIKKDFNIPVSVYWCDSEDPEKIAQLKKKGIRAKPVSKGAGSVYAGIQKVAEALHVRHEKGPDYYIMEPCVHLISEKQGYQWKRTKEDIQTEEPLKVDDHTQDAERYGFFMEYDRNKKTTF